MSIINEEAVFGMVAPNPFLFYYFLWEYMFCLCLFWFTPPFSGTHLGCKTSAMCTMAWLVSASNVQVVVDHLCKLGKAGDQYGNLPLLIMKYVSKGIVIKFLDCV